LILGDTDIGKLRGDQWFPVATIAAAGITGLLPFPFLLHLRQHLAGPALRPHSDLGRSVTRSFLAMALRSGLAAANFW
jgi:hypothetical protein